MIIFQFAYVFFLSIPLGICKPKSSLVLKFRHFVRSKKTELLPQILIDNSNNLLN